MAQVFTISTLRGFRLGLYELYSKSLVLDLEDQRAKEFAVVYSCVSVSYRSRDRYIHSMYFAEIFVCYSHGPRPQ